ncbi:MAG: 3-phosphoshikimate 1-carboxyvinyltransferase [Thermoprotei archaeon]|jgi:3-phosphoshikimate 1-carboxyvinyltransferase
MRIKVYPARYLEGVLSAPPSKSYTHRALFIALLTNGGSSILNMLNSADTNASMQAVRAFGGKIKNNVIIGVEKPIEPDNVINCKDSGTTIRFAASVASLVHGLTILTGSNSLRKRPMKPLENALGQLGALVVTRNGKPPLAIVGGKIVSDNIEIDGSVSSQFISGLLIISPKIGLTVNVVGKMISKPYIDMTIRTMKSFGVTVKQDGMMFTVERQPYKPTTFTVPGDYSSAAFLFAIGSLLGRVRVLNLKSDDVQADKMFINIIKEMGAKVSIGLDYVDVERGALEGIEVDCSDLPDIVPILSVLGAYAKGKTIIKGISHLRFKESDRIKTTSENLRRMGVDVKDGADYIEIKGREKLKGATLNSFGDHRIAMAFTVAALAAEGYSIIKGVESIVDSYPSFLDHVKILGGNIEVM